MRRKTRSRGIEDGSCVLAAYNVAKPRYLIFTRSGGTYSKTGKGPADEFNEYRAGISAIDVILQSTGRAGLGLAGGRATAQARGSALSEDHGEAFADCDYSGSPP